MNYNSIGSHHPGDGAPQNDSSTFSSSSSNLKAENITVSRIEGSYSSNTKADNDAAVENVAVDESQALLLPSPSTTLQDSKASVSDGKTGAKHHVDNPQAPSKLQDESEEAGNEYSSQEELTFWGKMRHTIFEKNFGLFLILLAQFFASIMALTTRLLEIRYTFHPLEILFVRMFVTAACGSAFMWWKKIPDFPLGARSVRSLLLLRGWAGFIGVFGLYYSLAYLDLADAIVITFLVPSVASLGCWIILHEPFTLVEVLAGVVAFVGVLFIARPPFIFPGSSGSPGNQTPGIPEVSPSQRLLAVGLALIGIFGAATAYTTIRCIGHRAHALISVNYFAGVTTVVSFIVIMLHPALSLKIPQEAMEWFLLTVIGFTGFIMQFLLTAGLQREKASRATNMVYTQLIFAIIWERWVFGSVPVWQSWVGCGLIIVAATWVATQKSKGGAMPATSTARAPPNDEERALLSPRTDNTER